MAESLTLYKLIVLYMLEQVDFPLTNAQISGFILDKGYTNYFHLQQAISELTDSGLIRSETVRNASISHGFRPRLQIISLQMLLMLLIHQTAEE